MFCLGVAFRIEGVMAHWLLIFGALVFSLWQSLPELKIFN